MHWASFAIRSSFVETGTELDVSFIFPSNGSMPRCRPLLDGVPRVGSPVSALVLRHSDFQLPRLAHSRLLGGSGHAAPEKTGSPLFLDDRRHACPGSPIPVEPLEQSPPGPRSLRFAPPASPSELADPSASTTSFLSGSNSAACVLAVYASQPGSPLDHARLASGWRLCLAGREFNPPGRCVRFPITCWRSHGVLLTEAARRTAR